MSGRVDSEAAAKLLALTEKATPGPWFAGEGERSDDVNVWSDGGTPAFAIAHDIFKDADREFIAAANPAFVAALIADWERRGQALAAYETAVQTALARAPLHWQEYRDPFELRPEISAARKLGREALDAARLVLDGEPAVGEPEA